MLYKNVISQGISLVPELTELRGHKNTLPAHLSRLEQGLITQNIYKSHVGNEKFAIFCNNA